MSDQEEQVSGSEYEDEEEEIEQSVATEAPPPPAAEPAAEESSEQPEPTEAATGEEGGEEEQEEGGDENEAPEGDGEESERKTSRRATIQQEEPDESQMTEAQIAMLNAKKRKEQEDELRAMDADARRKQELQNIESELVELKRRQEERRKEREVEERQEAERRKEEAQKHAAEMEARRARMEEEKNRRAEEKYRRQAQAGSFAGTGEKGEVNFTINKTGQKESQDKDKKKGGGLTKEQKEAAKNNYMSIVNKPVDVANLLPNDIKTKIKQLHSKIVRLEHEKYDLEQRHARQDYDLRELNEREAAKNRSKAIAAGVELEQEGSTKPPKISVASKFDRQKDRVEYGVSRDKFENPNVPPPKSIARGSGRPPAEWGRRTFDELEALRKTLEPPQSRYTEVAPVEGAKPPVDVIPMQIPTEEFDPSLAEKETAKSTRPFGVDKVGPKDVEPVENGTAAPTGGDTELEIVEEPVDE